VVLCHRGNHFVNIYNTEAGKNVNLETHLTGVLSNRIHPLGRMLERFSYDFLKKYDGSEVSKHFENKSSLIFHTFFQAYIRLEGSCSPCAEIKDSIRLWISEIVYGPNGNYYPRRLQA